MAAPCSGRPWLWLVTAGDQGADLTLRCTVRTKTLAQLATPVLTAWAEDKPIPVEKILPILQEAMKSSDN